MLEALKEYKGAVALAFVASLIALYDGGVAALVSVLILMVLEVSLSFDNAIVNAKALGSLSESQRQWFLTWGFFIAVIGMRLIFPILIVSGTAGIAPIGLGEDNVTMIAIHHPDVYAKLLADTHILVAGFGGAFLMMVGLQFFFDYDKDLHWLAPIEKVLGKFGSINFSELLPLAETIVTAIVLVVIAKQVPTEGLAFFYAGLVGIAAFILVSGLKHFMEGDDGEETTGSQVVGTAAKAGMGMLLFMEVRDASFSFDGVIGAFAISENLLLIMLGLGVGAYAVRKMTLHLVKTGTLAEYRYLEHGAFWAIISLAVLMLNSAHMHIPEVVTGLVGFFFIASAFVSSLVYKRADAAGTVTA